jgi:16S rRNA U516 pseudouridylate synthase RsuA-like enzyme
MNKNPDKNIDIEPIEFPIRINRYLYLKNYCSRRKADEFIENGQVKINGEKAVLGQKVNETDKGVTIEGYKTKPAKVEITGDRSFNIILTEGKKHQIRRMVAALGCQVSELKRTRIMNLKLSGLYPGQSRPLKQSEKVELLKSIGVM